MNGLSRQIMAGLMSDFGEVWIKIHRTVSIALHSTRKISCVEVSWKCLGRALGFHPKAGWAVKVTGLHRKSHPSVSPGQ